MIALIPGLAGALVVAGILAMIAGIRRRDVAPAASSRTPSRRRGLWLSRRSRLLLAVGLALGVAGWAVTGLALAVVLIPVAVLGLPVLVSGSPSSARIARLEAMEEWTRSLAGVLSVGLGLEQALAATLRSTPAAIAPQVHRLVARLRARWETEAALRAFADELGDATGDLIAANLILGARRRGAGLASVLEGLAESVTADVRARREVEADRAKPRASARWVTIITVGVLSLLAASGDYVAPYRTPAGQALLAVLLSAYVAALVWMRRMSEPPSVPRFLASNGTSPR